MIDNTSLLEGLIDQDTIHLCKSNILFTNPAQLQKEFNFDKVEGMLLGAAIGDSLGATSEGLLPSERRKRFDEIQNYVPGRRSKGKSVGVPTDDTQLTFWTLKQLILDGGLIPDNLAKRFCKYHISGIGKTTKRFISHYKDKNIPWYECGIDSLGNGALMRIAPVIVPYLMNPHPSMYADAALDAMITHNAYANVATCVSFVNILWQLLSMNSTPEPRWWIDSYCSIAEKLEGNSQYSPRISNYSNYKGSLWQFTKIVAEEALIKQIPVVDACDNWGSGANLFETIPSVIYILAKYAHDPEEAIIRAVNDTKDNDTIASIVGALMGALYGVKSLPERWIKGLTGRTRSDDDGQVFKLILMAKKAFWSS